MRSNMPITYSRVGQSDTDVETTARDLENATYFQDPTPPTPPPPSYQTITLKEPGSPPAYFHVRSNHYEKIEASYHVQKRSRRGPIICLVLTTVMFGIVALTIFGTVYHWGNSNWHY